MTTHRQAASMAATLLRSSGFRRRRNEFAKSEHTNLVRVLGFYPDSDGFALQYGVITPGLLSFRAARGVDPPDWPSTSESLLYAAVFHPRRQAGDRSDGFPYRWCGATVRDEDVPTYLEQALLGQVLPDLKTWGDPQLLAAALSEDRLGRFRGLPRQRAVAIALFELAPSTDLDEALQRLDEGDPVRRWIEGQFGAAT